MKSQNSIFNPDTLPRKGVDMGIEYLDDGRTRITHPYFNGKCGTWKQKTIDTQDKRKVAQAMLDLVNSCEGSLTDCRWKELSADYRAVNGDQGMLWYYSKLDEEFGNCKPDRKFLARYERLILRLRGDGKSENTISNFKSVIQRVFNYAYRHNKIVDIPIKDWNIERKFRSRMWVGDERQRFYNTMARYESPLYWSVRFLEERPTRGRSDLWKLTVDDLVLIGPNAPYLRYRPEKTERRNQAFTYMPLRDVSGDITGYLKTGRPMGCPLLFPRPDGSPMGYPIKHWRYICKKANISDFHIHDLKHIAISHMVSDLGYTFEMIKALGIQYSDESIRVYWKPDALKALEQVSRSIAGDFAERAKNAAN